MMLQTKRKLFVHTGSFMLVLLTLFSLFLTVIIALDWMQRAGTWFWEESTCTIETVQVSERSEHNTFAFEVTYSYRAASQTYSGNVYQQGYDGSWNVSEGYRLAERYPIGADVPCWVHQKQPERSCLRRASLWSGFLIAIPLFCAIVGGVSYRMVYRKKDTEPGNEDSKSEAPFRIKKVFRTRVVAAVLFSVFLIVGLGFFVPFFLMPALQVIDARSWESVPCEIISSNVRSYIDSNSRTGENRITYDIEVFYNYEVNGRQYRANRYQFMTGSSSGYESKAESVADIPAGAAATCYVNPEDPFDVVINRAFTADFLFALFPLAFVFAGAGGLYAVKLRVYGEKIKRERRRGMPGENCFGPKKGGLGS